MQRDSEVSPSELNWNYFHASMCRIIVLSSGMFNENMITDQTDSLILSLKASKYFLNFTVIFINYGQLNSETLNDKRLDDRVCS